MTATKKNSGKNLGGKKKGPIINGFRTIAEDDAILVKPENVAPFSLPVQAFGYVPADDVIITVFKSKDQERKIYCNIELSEKEVAQLKELQEEVKKQNLEFLPSITVMATRFLSRARGKTQEAIKLMLATQAWRLDFFKAGPVADADVLEDMKHGIVYFGGRDAALRPTIVVRCTRIPQQWYKEKRIDKLIRILIFCMEYMLRYMVMPGAIENNCLVVDLKGLSMFQVPIGALKDVYNVMSKHYIGRVFRFYICNLSPGLKTISNVATAILTDRQQQKLCFVNDVKDLRKEFALHQLEEDLGGTRPILKEFFPFPIQAGPYTAGAEGGPNPDEVGGAATVLSRDGATGRLWDSSLSKEDNTKLSYAAGAHDWFVERKIPVPPDCLKQHEAELKAAEEEKERLANLKEGEEDIQNQEEDDKVEMESEVEEAPPEEDDIILQDQVVKPRGFFSCRPCWCDST